MKLLELLRRKQQPSSAHPMTRSGSWTATHRHKKGGTYRLLSRGVNEADRTPVAIYDDEHGTIWVRTLVEFEDGRFTPLS